MFHTIIVGVDARDGGRDALALAERMARAFGGQLVAVHAYPDDYFISRSLDAEVDAALHKAAMETLETELERAGISARPVAPMDSSPARALHREAEREHADLIVVGSSHRGRIGRVLAGDVTASTLYGAPCPVVVAPTRFADHGGDLKRIGVGFDGSPESRVALSVARAVAEATDARLRVIDVVTPVAPDGPFAGYREDWTEHARIKREQAEARLECVLAELGEIATGVVAFGEPARELVYEAQRLDLLITGSRGYGPVRRLMLGSTSHRLVHEAPCPVMVLTRTAVEDGAPSDVVARGAHAS